MLHHRFVEFIPDIIDDGVLYISIEYCTAIHKCVCGCGNEVVTPFSATDWKLTFNGKTVTLNPSIGNWNFECQSHYWIRNSEIVVARSWTETEIRLGKERDFKRKLEYFETTDDSEEKSVIQESSNSMWKKILNLFRLKTILSRR